MADILIVAENAGMREQARGLLMREGFGVRVAWSGGEGMRKLGVRRPDLVLVEAAMRRMDGFGICETIRRVDRALPLIFLAQRLSSSEQVRALVLGADDYVSLGMGEAVFLARIRRAIARISDLDEPEEVLMLGKVSVGLATLCVRGGRQPTHLTSTERDILMILVQRAGAYVSRRDLAEALRGKGYICARGLIYTHVYNLRRKLGPAGKALICDRSLGYRLDR